MELFTPDEVAARLKVSRRTVYRWLGEGTLRAKKAGRGVRISAADLAAFLTDRQGSSGEG